MLVHCPNCDIDFNPTIGQCPVCRKYDAPIESLTEAFKNHAATALADGTSKKKLKTELLGRGFSETLVQEIMASASRLKNRRMHPTYGKRFTTCLPLILGFSGVVLVEYLCSRHEAIALGITIGIGIAVGYAPFLYLDMHTIRESWKRRRASHVKEPQPPEPSAEDLRQAIFILTSTDSRIRPNEFAAFVSSFVKETQAFFEEFEPLATFDCQVACALLPSGRMALDFQKVPVAAVSSTLEAGLLDRLRQLPRPSVAAPVAFTDRETVNGGYPESVEFDFPFADQFPEGFEGHVDDLLLTLETPNDAAAASDRPWTSGDYAMLIEIHPENIPARVGRARQLVAEGRFEAAMAEVNKAIDLDPHDPDLYATRADFQVDFKAIDDALADFAQALALRCTSVA